MLLEFGSDFSLAGRQRPIIIDQEIHTIDLEFYHRGIPCIIVVDLKIGKFKSEFVGQMNKYLNYYRENKMYPWEKSPVGLIICEYKGKEEVHYCPRVVWKIRYLSQNIRLNCQVRRRLEGD